MFTNKSKIGGGAPATPLDRLMTGIQAELNSRGHTFASSSVAKSALALEAIDPVAMNEVETTVRGLATALESVCVEHGKGLSALTQAQRDAGVAAAIISGDVAGFLSTPVARSVVATESMGFIQPQGSDYASERMRPALEAYDERENKNAIVYSVAYNMQAARQDEFGEAFFPTVVVTPDQVGFAVAIRLISVYNDVRRQISGEIDAFQKKNIIQAVIDPTILKNDLLKIVPVVRPQSLANFVDPTLVAPADILLDGVPITTAPLAMGKKFSLLGISQTDALLETGLQDTTDSIDTAASLAAIYMKMSGTDAATGAPVTEVVKFSTARLPTAVMNHAVQGNYRQMNLAFSTESLLVNAKTTDVAGAQGALLAQIVAGQYNVRLGVSVSGSINLELADTNFFASDVHVVSVTDVDGNQLALTSGLGATIAALFAGATMIGYDLEARRTNMNRRMRGQLLDTTYYNQVYAVPLRSPITIPRPLTVGDANDSTDLAALITATHIRTSNAAVEELLNVEQYLADYVSTGSAAGVSAPDILGVARFLVKPFYEHQAFDVSLHTDSLKSHERMADVRAALVNKIRDMVYRMYRDSGYKAAADALAGGVSQAPTVIIGTDPVIAQYLMTDGDFRTLGETFQVKIVSTLNRDMAGKIIVTFGQFGQGTEGVPNPMHFGAMAWKPELTLVLPIQRNGATSKELTVQPSFLHVTNLPLMCSLTVTGLSAIISGKATVNYHQV